METNTIIYTTRIFSNLISNDIITKGISDVAFSIYGILFGLVDIKNPELLVDENINEVFIDETTKEVFIVLKGTSGKPTLQQLY